MTKIVLLRHGESTWNKENLFTGWTDVDLSEQGKAEAKRAGELLKAEGFTFDVAFTSVLKRAIRTLWIVLDELDLMWIPVEHSWRLNERHYGALQGLNKAQTAAKYGDEQVLTWRRSYDVPPPPLEESDPRFPGTDPRYRGLSAPSCPGPSASRTPSRGSSPTGTSPSCRRSRAGKKVIIAAHGNSLRALVKYLDDISDQEIVGLNIPTGVPLVYELDESAQADPALLPRRSRGGRAGRGGRRQPGEGEIVGRADARRYPSSSTSDHPSSKSQAFVKQTNEIPDSVQTLSTSIPPAIVR